MTENVPDVSPSLLRHRRQFFWQILLPVLVAVLAGLALAVLTVVAGLSNASQTRLWADISTIWLAAPLLGLTLVLGIVLVVSTWGLARLTRFLLPYTRLAQSLASRAASGLQKVADGAAKPMLLAGQIGASFDWMFSFLRGKGRR